MSPDTRIAVNLHFGFAASSCPGVNLAETVCASVQGVGVGGSGGGIANKGFADGRDGQDS
jgi:hypothetical protein